ncbi:23S rRNA (uracil(1939)-C(5))-methyltransferase RlmD [Ligilactobacillus sp. WILCCON 0076]|uniref:23S rRNA (Uracil(1939)-C(5))-methyltransferase RlmD n=1 Tax=Ligilactobacillus ubinensis TaxID=2876789 RepID=A0A9X2FI51_9LACO|nr:23S rRNA (uracil(1939)-C(5))-methyltransferase RlmD [Ligilactobacillus ubinensis]MCP0886085.1 23S rRNA (uracil(1939)-C(5))-methyltransferase RlmD [Ligilactobacillus ubinensis]
MAKLDLPVYIKQELTVTIIDLSYQGLGVAKVEGYPLFIEGALPDEVVDVRVTKITKHFGYAQALKWQKFSPERVTDVDNRYLQTGIAPLQHMTYAAQLDFKRKIVTDLLKKAHLETIAVEKTRGMEHPFAYRNKAQVPVRKIDGQLEIGFFKHNSHDFIPMDNFLIQDKRIDEVLCSVRDILREFHIRAYNEVQHSGVVRHILVRRGYYSKQVMVVIVTRTAHLKYATEIAAKIQSECPDVLSVQQNVNSAKTNVILGAHTNVIAGTSEIEDQLNGLTFKISAQSFYQINPQQTEILYTEALKRAELTGDETVIDAYCGIGTISLNLAKQAKRVYGVEIVSEAITDAKRNAAVNGLGNVTFKTGEAEKWMEKWQTKGIKPNVIVVDPPRKGLTNSLIESACAMQPDRVVYVSCNPATLVRDIQKFMELGYNVSQPILPVDQFPQTTHVECVTVLSRTNLNDWD